MPVVSLRECSPPLVVAIDLGTSSARAILFDSRGRSIEGLDSHIRYKMEITPDGGVQIDPDRLVEIVSQNLDELLRQASVLQSARAPIAAVALSTFWHALMGVDRDGRVATPLYSWNDTRAASTAADLRRQVDERALHSRTGCVLHASYWPAKLAWLRTTQAGAFERVACWMSIGEYLHLRFLGRSVCSISMASATGLFNQNECTWDREILSHLKISAEQLSQLGDADTQLGGLRAEYAARWPLLGQVRWFPALGDGACSNVGSGCVTRDRAAINIGTSAALRVLWEAQSVAIPDGLWCYRADRRRFVMGGALSNGGDLFAWMLNTLKLGPPEEVEAQLAAMEPDAHGLTVLPFLSGERSTGWVAGARAVVAGMSLDTTSLEILRAGLESVGYRFAAIYDLVKGELGEPREIVASGAAVSSSPAWVQIISDVLGRPIVTSAEPEASSRGAVLMALEALGEIGSIEQAETSIGRLFMPDPKSHEQYLKARERQDRLYRALFA